MKDVIVGLAALVIGGVFCFWGYFAMRLVIPIWGFFAGFMLGAGATSWMDNSEFLSTVLGWIIGFFVGLLFAVLAYLFYEIAIVLTFAAIGFTFGADLMIALNIDWEWFIVLIGIAVGILFGIFAPWCNYRWPCWSCSARSPAPSPRPPASCWCSTPSTSPISTTPESWT